MVKIGMIGMSSGNAHPYSWSAIINGQYERSEIEKAGYGAVAEYLNQNRNSLGIDQASVTHIWTQDHLVSKSIARSSGINVIVQSMADMIGEVDAVILARDDAQHHVAMSAPFLEADIPIFIDKPLAVSHQDLNWFSDQVDQGKFLMSCSSMRYAREVHILKEELEALGQIHLVTAVGKKDWPKYGVHMLEAIFTVLNDPLPHAVRHVGKTGKDIVHLILENEIEVTLHLFGDISSTFQLSVFGEKDWKIMDIKDYYNMFRDNLIEFIRSVEDGSPRIPFKKTKSIIHTLLTAMDSLEQNGQPIELNT